MIPLFFWLKRRISLLTLQVPQTASRPPALPGRDLPFDAIDEIRSRILGGVDGISRISLDISPKPPATTEWE